MFVLESMGYTNPYWLTYNQAKTLGGYIRRGERSTPVVFWKRLESERENPRTGQVEIIETPLLRYYRVFNVHQCEGLDGKIPPLAFRQFHSIERAEEIVQSMPQPPAIENGVRAFYRPATDGVMVPRPDVFNSDETYYSTLFHELTHSTGHPSRLNRFSKNYPPFASPDYSREELVAEMGAAFLCGHCAILNTTIDNSAAYLAGWLSKLRNDKRLVVVAGGQAQKAADFIRGVQNGPR